MEALQASARQLIFESLLVPTRIQYARTLSSYANFCGTHFPNQKVLPIQVQHVLVYIAEAYSRNLAASTIRTAISALSFVQNLVGGIEFSQNFLVVKALAGVAKTRPSKENRAPLSQSQLQALLVNAHLVVGLGYKQALFKAMFSLAFHAFLRVGEITTGSASKRSKNTLQLTDVVLSKQPLAVTISFRDYKHKVPGSPSFLLKIIGDGSNTCVVGMLATYLHVRGYSQGPLFCTEDGKAVSRNYFCDVLRDILGICGGETRLKPHSFRIGGATEAIRRGYSAEQVQAMGRWRSQAFRHYIRLPKATVDFRDRPCTGGSNPILL